MVGCRNKSIVYFSKNVQEWQGKEILIPAHIDWKVLGEDTICSDLLLLTQTLQKINKKSMNSVNTA